MAEVGYAAALALALVFAWAGVAKLTRRTRTARAFAALGLAAPRLLAVAVPTLELALAAGLVVAPADAAVGALAVLAAFTTILVRARLAGVVSGCGCFGAARPTPVSSVELVRNALLAVAAVVAASGGGVRRLSLPAVLLVLAGGGVALATMAWVGRRGGDPGGRAGGPPLDAPAPSVPGGPDYAEAALTLVAFTAPTCASCAALGSVLDALAGRDDVQVHVVELDDATNPTFAAFGVRATPSVVAVDAEGVVRGRRTGRATLAVERLVERAGRRAERARAQRG